MELYFFVTESTSEVVTLLRMVLISSVIGLIGTPEGVTPVLTAPRGVRGGGGDTPSTLICSKQ